MTWMALSTNFAYDGDDRVQNARNFLFWYGPGGEVLEETDTAGNNARDYIFFNGERLARRDNVTGNVYYFFHDRLGSTRIATDAAGNILQNLDYYPFGDTTSSSTSTLDNYYLWTGKFQDSTGDYFFHYRVYTPYFHRWISGDPVGGDASNPQSLNRYAYVLNNPVNNIDPEGLFSIAKLLHDVAHAFGGFFGFSMSDGGGGGRSTPTPSSAIVTSRIVDVTPVDNSGGQAKQPSSTPGTKPPQNSPSAPVISVAPVAPMANAALQAAKAAASEIGRRPLPAPTIPQGPGVPSPNVNPTMLAEDARMARMMTGMADFLVAVGDFTGTFSTIFVPIVDPTIINPNLRHMKRGDNNF